MEDAHGDKGKDSSAHEDFSVNEPNICNTSKNFVFEIDMKFNSEEESYNAYNSYAVARGFGVQKGGKTNSVKGETTRRLFLCSCEGQSDKLSPFQERKHKD
ncbi:hypothetical protein P3S67_008944 [Capsicum chacoense]